MERAFLERDRETEALSGWLEDVGRSGNGIVALVGGEAGVGKTTLVRRFCDERGRPLVLWGVCDPLATPAPLGPVVEVAAQLDGAAAEAIAGGGRPYEVGRALLEDLAGERPAIVVLEDLHWADDGTLDVLVYLARRVERAPALVIGTYRDEGSGPADSLRSALGLLATAPRVERLALESLSAEAVRTLADEAGRDADAVFETTRGNPFFVTELLASAPGELPANARDAVLARVAQLDDDARALIDLVSVVPPRAELWLLEAIPDAPVDALDRCLAAGVLERRAGAVSFRHELARLAVEGALSEEAGAALHRQVLAALEEAGAEPARLAHHAAGAGDAAALLRHARAAGERSAALGAHREAAEQYGRALSVADSLPDAERAALLSRYAFERYLTDRLTDAIDAQREAVELLRAAGDRAGEGDGLRLLSRFLWFGGRGEEAEAAGLEAVAVLEELPADAALARAYSNLAQLRMLAYDTTAAIEWGTRALRLASELGAEEIVVHALANVGTAEVLAGREAEGRAKLEESLGRARALGLDDDVGRAYANLSSQALERRQFALADRYLADGIAFCDEHDLASYGLYLRAWRARLALDSGRWAAAAEQVEEVLAHPQASPPTRIVAGVAGGLLAVRRGEAERGEALLADALALAAADRRAPAAGPGRRGPRGGRLAAGRHRGGRGGDGRGRRAGGRAATPLAPRRPGGMAAARRVGGEGWRCLAARRRRAGRRPRGGGGAVERSGLPVRGGARPRGIRRRGGSAARPRGAHAAGRRAGGADRRAEAARRRGARHPARPLSGGAGEPRRPHRARARGARADGPAASKRGHRPRAGDLAADRGPPRLADPRQARRRQPHGGRRGRARAGPGRRPVGPREK